LLVAMTFIPIEIVITGLDPVNHLLRRNFLRRLMDARIKSGHDECVSRGEVEDRFTRTNFNFQQPKRFQTCLRDPATRSARAVDKSSAPIEGVGNAGCPLHPRSRVHFVLVERTRVTTSTPERPAFPHAMVLRLMSCSCVRKICQNVRTGGSHQPPVAGSEPVRARRPQEPAGERGTGPVSSSTRTVAWA
jgi:hypothetical protein